MNDIPRLRATAELSGSALIDVRVPPPDIPVGTGKRRNGRRLLTVGTDRAVGKKYTALALERDMRASGLDVDFRASGQTGIIIAGTGIPIDAVVSDLVSGAAELLSPENHNDHWDVIEGQGSICHPGYGAVPHGLFIGSQPDAFVVCHDATRDHIGGWPDFKMPGVRAVIERTVAIGSLTSPDIRCIGISVNTSGLHGDERDAYLADLSRMFDLPCVDPLVDGTRTVIDRLKHGNLNLC